jgi:D-glycero-D-manno-heptose 1,7-bisphosphate phosphatase
VSGHLLSGKVVILDRDGTIVIDREYLSDPAELEFMPRAVDGLRALHELGYRLVVVTNQSGVGRGLYSEHRLHEIHDRLTDMMRLAGAPLAGIYYCPHAPEAGCACRKPATGLLIKAASELNFEPASAITIGDKFSDVEFGRRAGTTTILLSSKGSPTGSAVAPDFVVENLWEAARAINALGGRR